MSMDPIPDDQDEQMSTLSSSIVLSSLPTDATEILTKYGQYEESNGNDKSNIRFRAIGSAPILRTQIYKISNSQKVSVLVKFLKQKLGLRQSDSLFLYVNNAFAPGLDENVGNLFRTFAIDNHLIISYCSTVAFG